jgi:hypothetical protein
MGPALVRPGPPGYRPDRVYPIGRIPRCPTVLTIVVAADRAVWLDAVQRRLASSLGCPLNSLVAECCFNGWVRGASARRLGA